MINATEILAQLNAGQLVSKPTILAMAEELARLQQRYRMIQTNAYKLGVGNPTPEEFDAAVDYMVRHCKTPTCEQGDPNDLIELKPEHKAKLRAQHGNQT
jgi:hypothetical protein